ncbi:hypothetical protein KIPB_007154, partial [Kipferlia bialata]|eukprot:g7154.t1
MSSSPRHGRGISDSERMCLLESEREMLRSREAFRQKASVPAVPIPDRPSVQSILDAGRDVEMGRLSARGSDAEEGGALPVLGMYDTQCMRCACYMDEGGQGEGALQERLETVLKALSRERGGDGEREARPPSSDYATDRDFTAHWLPFLLSPKGSAPVSAPVTAADACSAVSDAWSAMVDSMHRLIVGGLQGGSAPSTGSGSGGIGTPSIPLPPSDTKPKRRVMSIPKGPSDSTHASGQGCVSLACDVTTAISHMP